MAEYIERGPLIEICENQGHADIDDILSVEVAEVAPVVHAEWVQVIYHVEFEDGFVDRVYECCSACHMPNGRKMTDYCPNCGAKMDGGQHETD